MHLTTRTILLALCLSGCSSSATSLRGLGKVATKSLCGEPKRCDVRGDEAVTTLGATPLYLAEGQGPESYLGKVAPAREARSVLKTCGGDVKRDDWLETGPTVRVLELNNDAKAQLRSMLKAQLAEELLAHPQLFEERKAGIDSVVEGASSSASLQRVTLLSQTYWLKDPAFERRVAQCGEEEMANIIYSFTLLRLSDLTQNELQSKLLHGLETRLAPELVEDEESGERRESPETAAANAAQRALLKEVASGAVRGLAGELRLIAAFGFDES